jgi:hypothetical protein
MEPDPRIEKKEEILKHTGWTFNKAEARRSGK